MKDSDVVVMPCRQCGAEMWQLTKKGLEATLPKNPEVAEWLRRAPKGSALFVCDQKHRHASKTHHITILSPQEMEAMGIEAEEGR